MGISTIQSYCGAQIFEAVGLERALVDRHFTGTASRIGGIGLEVLAAEALERHARAYPRAHEELLPVGGVYAWRRDGEHHMWNPETIALLQHAVRGRRRRAEKYERVLPPGQRGRRPPGDAARAAAVPQPTSSRSPLEEVEAAKRDRQALRHRRDVARLDLDARPTRRWRSR